jgi:transposase-like protein
MSSVSNGLSAASKNVIQIDEQQIRSHVEEVVRTSVEETLNGLLDAEADQLCQARKYERTDARRDTRAQPETLRADRTVAETA